jgi:hypothetical protein
MVNKDDAIEMCLTFAIDKYEANNVEIINAQFIQIIISGVLRCVFGNG